MHLTRTATAIGLALTLAHCGGNGARLPRAPTLVRDDPAFAATESTSPPGVPDDPPSPFVLLPGDTVRLRTLSIDPLDVDALTVDTSGRLTVPLAGSVLVGSLGMDDASSRIETALHRFDRFARIVLTVTDAGGHRATITGAVEHPGMYPLRGEVRVADLVALSGGPRGSINEGEFVDTVDLEGARLIREGVTLPISVARAMEAQLQHNVRVHPGDVLLMPPSRGQRVSVLGQVRTPKSVAFRRGLRLMDAIAIAGGATDNADNTDVRVIRGPLSHPRIYRASLNDVLDGNATDVELAPGDVVFVTEHWFATATRVIERLAPLLTMGALATAVVR